MLRKMINNDNKHYSCIFFWNVFNDSPFSSTFSFFWPLHGIVFCSIVLIFIKYNLKLVKQTVPCALEIVWSMLVNDHKIKICSSSARFLCEILVIF